MANIVNITASFSVSGPVKIPKTAEYKYYLTKKGQDIRMFPGAIYKKFGHTFILFKSGKIICVGGRKLSDVEEVCIKVARIINGISRIYDFEIKNLVASRNLGCYLNLDSTAELIKSHNIRICFDPELIAALYVYTEKCLVILFHTGKIIFTGVQKQENIDKSWEIIKKFLIWK